MQRTLKKTNVIVELLEEEPIIILLKRKLFVHAKIISVGSEVTCVKPGDKVTVFNEGRELKRGTRVVDQEAVILKYLNHAIQSETKESDGRSQVHPEKI